MLKYFITVCLLSLFINCTYAADSTIYSCKYRYTWQKDTKLKDSKSNDIMILEINKNSTLYYSYLKQLGFRNKEADEKKKTEKPNISVSGNMVNIDANSRDNSKYFLKNETEVISINYKTKKAIISDKLLSTAYRYEIELNSPSWKLSNDTMIILNQICQKATTYYLGRNYTAWFASSIPIKFGPWLFNNLPGLIMKVEDERKQFVFECIELNTPDTKKVFKEYPNTKNVTKKELRLKKKALYEDPISFMEAESGVTITTTDATTGNPVAKKIKSYNPLDLTKF